MKGAFLLFSLVLVQATLASAEPTRSLPKGEERPHLIERIFFAPEGEVQLTSVGLGGHSGFLRTETGNLLGFQAVNGSSACEQWFLSDAKDALPGDCEFVFRDDFTGSQVAVRSSEMQESDLFEATRGVMRGWRNHVAL
jgi:hypothetical protein